MLEGQLGARPSAALEHARASLGSSRPAQADRAVAVVAPASPSASRPLVGRRGERDRIAHALAAAQHGKSREVLWICGEPGIGKTRLLEEVADQARTLGGPVLAGRAYEAEMVR